MNVALAVVFVVCALNPAAAAASLAGQPVPRAALGIGAAVAICAYLLATATRTRLLEALAVEPATFLVAAGAIVAASGAAVIIGRPAYGPVEWRTRASQLVPLAVPLLLAPAPLAATIAAALHASAPAAASGAVVAVVAAVALIAARTGRHALTLGWAARLLAALALVIAAGVIVDGIRTI